MSSKTDYWRVNSYGYPNPFSTEAKAVQAWETLLSFYDFSSYLGLKNHWSSTSATRYLSPHAVESWKATFEEFGLLYVLSGTDRIVITPAGYQFRNAADSEQRQEFAWIGLSLLLRYPLRGSRRPKGPRHAESDLLLYWFLYAAMRELRNYFWRTELNRVLCKVFMVEEAERAVANVLKLRVGDAHPDEFPLPAHTGRGGFYNSLNQVIVHAGMNFLVFGKSRDDNLYGESKEVHVEILREWLPVVDLALGGNAIDPDCDNQSRFVARMPKAPDFQGEEQPYFEYLGAKVEPMPVVAGEQPIPYASISGGAVAVLSENVHYRVLEPRKIVGTIEQLCGLAVRQRIILSHDLRWSYIIEQKQRTGPRELVLEIRPARPITNVEPILPLLRRDNG